MTIKLLLKKLYLSEKEFYKDDTIKEYCKSLEMDYKNTINYLLRKGYMLRIFRGIFYLRTLDEIKLDKRKYNHLELVSKGLELKKSENWYFGLYTALKLNNMTHEHFTVDYVINDRIFRAIPMKISGYKFKFHKLKPNLFRFGIIKDTMIRYSNPEKTILDFIHIWRYNGVPKERIIIDLTEYTKEISKEKIIEYAEKYSNPVRKIAEEMIG